MEKGQEVSRKAFQKALEGACNVYRAFSDALRSTKTATEITRTMQVSLSAPRTNSTMLRTLSKLPRSRVTALTSRGVSGSARAAQQEGGSAASRGSDVPVRRSGRPRQTSVARPYNRPGTMTPFSLTSGLAPVLPTRFDSLFRDLERELDGLLGGGALTTPADTDLPVDPRTLLGSVDIRETNKDYQFVVDVPGLTKDDVKVRVSGDNILTVEGERKDEREEDEDGFRRRERFVGKWERRFQLPENTEPEHIQAKVDNGVLKVIVPKTEKHEQQGTEVNVQ